MRPWREPETADEQCLPGAYRRTKVARVRFLARGCLFSDVRNDSTLAKRSDVCKLGSVRTSIGCLS